MDDHEIADQLNQDGLTTTEGKVFTYAGVRWIRYKHNISGPYQRNRIGISVAEAANLLNISTGKNLLRYFRRQDPRKETTSRMALGDPD